jgi:hypothetical protein
LEKLKKEPIDKKREEDLLEQLRQWEKLDEDMENRVIKTFRQHSARGKFVFAIILTHNHSLLIIIDSKSVPLYVFFKCFTCMYCVLLRDLSVDTFSDVLFVKICF